MSAANLQRYEALVTARKLELKGKATRYTSLNGNMFSFLTKEGKLALRLPRERLEEVLKKYRTERCVQHGAVMKEYALIPDSLLRKSAEVKKLFKESCDYAETLKPKKTTRSSAKKKPAKKASKKTTKKKPAKKTTKKKPTKKAAKKTTKKKPTKKAAKKTTKKTPAKKPTKKAAKRKATKKR